MNVPVAIIRSITKRCMAIGDSVLASGLGVYLLTINPNSDNIYASSIQGILKRIKPSGLRLLICITEKGR